MYYNVCINLKKGLPLTQPSLRKLRCRRLLRRLHIHRIRVHRVLLLLLVLVLIVIIVVVLLLVDHLVLQQLRLHRCRGNHLSRRFGGRSPRARYLLEYGSMYIQMSL